ncbi:tetratricopeptide repeat protein [Agaribacter flavus]|uniref:Tetratricopeptide repeat protein n=1 Tax=Agaribacter flavus TaxID=1902781 RepID=A0ABV7FRB9_9ALTE
MSNEHQGHRSADEASVQSSGNSTETSLVTTEQSPENMLVAQLISQPNLYRQSQVQLDISQRNIMLKALRAYKDGDVKGGMHLIQEAEQAGQLNSAAYVLKSDLAMAAQDEKEALAHLQKALRINPYNYIACNRLAHLMRKQGNFAQALSLYNRAIAAVPSDAGSYRNRGILYDLYIQDKAEALEDYKRYHALLEHQRQERVSEKPLLKAIDKDIKQVKGWLLDLSRQLQAIENTREIKGEAE